MLSLNFLFKELEPWLLLPEQFFKPSDLGVKFGEDIMPPIPESSNIDLSEDVVGDREIRCDCNGTDSGETKGFGVEFNCESSAPKPWPGGGGGKNVFPCGV